MNAREKEAAIASAKAQYRTNHVLHFLMSVVTLGLWIPVWLFKMLMNWSREKDIDRMADDLNAVDPTPRPFAYRIGRSLGRIFK